ncbi:hypothetical protein D3C72_1024550 [compost metagenome]
MHLDQHIHAERKSLILKPFRLVVGKRGHDEENAVRAPGTGFMHLVSIEHEILAQRRQSAGIAGGGQEFRCALKARRIRQNRQTSGATGFIGGGQRRRIEIRTDQALGGARLLDFGDQPELAFGLLCPQRFIKAAGRALVCGHGLQIGQRNLRLGGGDFLALVSLDLFENVAHDLALILRWTRQPDGRARLRPCRCPAPR